MPSARRTVRNSTPVALTTPRRLGSRQHSAGACSGWTVSADTEISGPMSLRLFVETQGSDDVYLFVVVEIVVALRLYPVEGAYGFGRDRITCGWLKASMRSLDETCSRAVEPVPTLDASGTLQPGQPVPSASLLSAGGHAHTTPPPRSPLPANATRHRLLSLRPNAS